LSVCPTSRLQTRNLHSRWQILQQTIFTQVDSSKRTPLHWAAIGGHVRAGEVLVGAGADIFAVTSSGSSILHGSAEAGKADFVAFAVAAAGARKVDLFNLKDSDGKVAFSLAQAVRSVMDLGPHRHYLGQQPLLPKLPSLWNHGRSLFFNLFLLSRRRQSREQWSSNSSAVAIRTLAQPPA